MKLHIILAAKDEKTRLVEHAYLGVAVFASADAARKHLDSIRAEGVWYEVMQLATAIRRRPRMK